MWRRMTRQLLLSDDSRRPTALVIRALGMIVGKLVRDERSISSINSISPINMESALHDKPHFISTFTITSGAQILVKANEVDIDLNNVTSRQIGGY